MLKAVFLDIDGTLISVRTHQPAPRTAQALLRAREKGVLLFVSTGRHTAVPEEGYILDLLPDCFEGFVGLTGQYCYTRGGDVVHKQPLDPEDVRRVKALALEHQIPYTYAYATEVYISLINDRVRRHNASLHLPIPTLREMNPRREVYSITLYIDPADDVGLLQPALKRTTTVSWMPGITDVCPLDGGKQAGVEAMLRHYGLSPADAMAVGDSDNDLSMFQCVGTTVAMGNSTPGLLKHATYVTAPCEEDGIWQAFSHFGLI